MNSISNKKILDIAKGVINAEVDGVNGLLELISDDFCQIVKTILVNNIH